MSSPPLSRRHLADLHQLASDLGVEGFRMLRREELVEQILERDPEAGKSAAPAAAASEPRRDGAEHGAERSGRRPGGDRGARSGGDRQQRSGEGRRDRPPREEAEDEGEVVVEPVSGVLDITSRGHGFVRLKGLEAAEGDVYVSPSQIRRCELERGDQVAGPARQPRRGERHPALVHVETVNGVEPGAERGAFSASTPVPPSRRIPLSVDPGDGGVLLRAADLLCPLAMGQRVLIKAAPGSGRTTLLRALAKALAATEGVGVIVLLVDERPEEAAAWREALPDAELAIATADMRPGEQMRLVELAHARAERRAEAGEDVVLLIDSISRIAVAADDPGRAKPIFAAGRETSEDEFGSFTVVATTLDGNGDGDGEDDADGVHRALETTENSLIALDRELASAGVVPALDAAGCRISGEDSLRDGAELEGARALRAELAGLGTREAAERLAELIGSSADNAALLTSLAG